MGGNAVNAQVNVNAQLPDSDKGLWIPQGQAARLLATENNRERYPEFHHRDEGLTDVKISM